jgi:hypothetical protein
MHKRKYTGKRWKNQGIAMLIGLEAQLGEKRIIYLHQKNLPV